MYVVFFVVDIQLFVDVLTDELVGVFDGSFLFPGRRSFARVGQFLHQAARICPTLGAVAVCLAING